MIINSPLISPPQFRGVPISLVPCPPSSSSHLRPNPLGAATASSLHGSTLALHQTLHRPNVLAPLDCTKRLGHLPFGFHPLCARWLPWQAQRCLMGARAWGRVAQRCPKERRRRWINRVRRRCLEDVRHHLIWAAGWQRMWWRALDFWTMCFYTCAIWNQVCFYPLLYRSSRRDVLV
jgi:hypothetical protein